MDCNKCKIARCTKCEGKKELQRLRKRRMVDIGKETNRTEPGGLENFRGRHVAAKIYPQKLWVQPHQLHANMNESKHTPETMSAATPAPCKYEWVKIYSRNCECSHASSMQIWMSQNILQKLWVQPRQLHANMNESKHTPETVSAATPAPCKYEWVKTYSRNCECSHQLHANMNESKYTSETMSAATPAPCKYEWVKTYSRNYECSHTSTMQIWMSQNILQKLWVQPYQLHANMNESKYTPETMSTATPAPCKYEWVKIYFRNCECSHTSSMQIWMSQNILLKLWVQPHQLHTNTNESKYTSETVSAATPAPCKYEWVKTYSWNCECSHTSSMQI